MSSKQLLEIDSSILERNLMLNEDLLNVPDDPLNLFSNQESSPFKLVKPNPGFCVKFRVRDNRKVFINVCHTEELPAPRDISEDELAEIIQSEEIPDFKIPMSIGDPHEEVDKSGGSATAYDIAINSKFFKKIQDSKSFNFLFLMIAIEGVENKFNIELNNDYTILQNRKFLGNLQYHRIRQTQTEKQEKKQKCLIEEIPPTTSVDKKRSGREISPSQSTEGFNLMRSIDQPIPQKESRTNFRILELEVEGKKYYIVEAYFSKIVDSTEISLNIGEDRLLVNSKKGSVLADTFFKSNVVANECRCQFNTKCQVLTIIAPIA
ncbi:unnamed protein product [Bemisia tabaci]|uniref:PIH1 domain-containing protein 1 n=1 Tax=Bemisia tabaci TaxID=7038 RepID=A0A9P0AA54_BEMTA|nr:unnamed protein product [Bemisia tabaci]